MRSESNPVLSARKVLSFADWYFARRHFLLFLALMITLIAGPITQEFQLSPWPVELMYLISVGVAAAGLDSPAGRRWAIVAIVLIASLRFVGEWRGLGAASRSGAALFVGLALVAAVMSLRFALRGKHVDRERLTAALSTYLLAGHMFGVCYWELQHVRAGTFAAGGTPVIAGGLPLPDCIYFSFVTLATLGYGDISPLTPTARGLAVSEAILGQLFLAVLIARLVGGGGANSGASETR